MRWMLVTSLLIVLAGIAVAEPRVIDLPITRGELPQNMRVIAVRHGDDVTLRWTTDKPLEIHLHGYDLTVNLRPGAPTPMHFTAKSAGRFAIEVHGLGPSMEPTVGYLEVHPR